MSHFIPIHVKKSVQQIGLEYGLFSQKFKIKRTIVEETDTAKKKEKKKKLSIFKFEGQSAR